MAIEASGYKHRYCIWMTSLWCNGAIPSSAFKNLKLIPQHQPNDYAESQAASDWPCNARMAGMQN